jgi:hypothetical protein
MSKCAGRSIKRFLVGNYIDSWGLWNDGTELSDEEIEVYNKKDLIVGHMSHVSAQNFNGYKMITFLRDPLTRTISEYNHLLTQDTNFLVTKVMREYDFSFMDFMRSVEPYVFSWTNIYLAYLGYHDPGTIKEGEIPDFMGKAKNSLNAMDFVGIYEYLNESLYVLKAKYGLNGDFDVVGKTAKINQVAKLEDLTNDEIAESKEILSDDYELYSMREGKHEKSMD